MKQQQQSIRRNKGLRSPQSKPFALSNFQTKGKNHLKLLQLPEYQKAFRMKQACMAYGKQYYDNLFLNRESDGKNWSDGLPEQIVNEGRQMAIRKLALNNCAQIRKRYGDQARKAKAELIAKRDTHMMIQTYARGNSLPYHPYL